MDGDFRLDIVGEGSLSEQIRQAIAGDERMTYHGKMEIKQVHELLERTDCVLLPSSFDGWGCTVNEGLLHGCRCVVSDRAGSHSLIKYTGYGSIFPSGNWTAFREAMRKEMGLGKVSEDERAAIKRWSTNIQPKAVSEYLIDVINYYYGDRKEKPIAPWRTDLMR